MAIWWSTNGWNKDIEAVEVLNETAKQLLIREPRWGRDGFYERRVAKRGYFASFNEARQYLIDAAKLDIERLTREMERTNNKLARYEALEEPKQ